MVGVELARAVEALASRILADHDKASDQHALASARQIAEAEFDLARVQRIKVALIDRAHNLGRLEPRKSFRTKMDEAAWAMQYFLRGTLGIFGRNAPSTRCRPCRRRSRSAPPRRSGARYPTSSASRGMNAVPQGAGTEQFVVSRKALSAALTISDAASFI